MAVRSEPNTELRKTASFTMGSESDAEVLNTVSFA